MKTGGIILAAGLSSRMGCYKPLADINGKPMIFWTIDSMLEGGAEQVVVVTGHNRELLTSRISEKYGDQVSFAFNKNYDNGKMFESVLAGVQKLSDIDAFYMLLADMPGVSERTFRLLREAKERTGKEIILPTVNGYRKHPPLIDASLIEDIMHYHGFEGMRGFWKQEQERIYEVPVEDEGCLLDADTPGDLGTLRKYLAK